ncbi:MAG TPA: T9SS type A sorting domain-containing protein [Flavobacteriales bacterium]|nr:T9SS type A sorting domain-containing protein [Flavobacteriales bacterium]
MKKILLTSFTIFAFGLSNAQLTNLGFETWSSGSPDDWISSNLVASGSVTQITSGAPEGSSAVACNVVSCPFCPAISMPDPFPGGVAQQDAYTARPATMTFKWKGLVNTGDTGLVGTYLSLSTVPVGDALFYIMPGTNQTTWQTETVNFTYSLTSDPDTILVGVLSDAWVLQLITSGSATGTSTLGGHIDVDDIVFAGGTIGIDMLETTNPLIVAYPNPAHTVINLNLLGTNATSLQVIDLNGKTVYSENNILSKHLLNVENYANGAYVVKFYSDKNEFIGSARFNVAK